MVLIQDFSRVDVQYMFFACTFQVRQPRNFRKKASYIFKGNTPALCLVIASFMFVIRYLGSENGYVIPVYN